MGDLALSLSIYLSLSLSLSLYLYLYLFLSISLYLSLYLYIYIYISSLSLSSLSHAGLASRGGGGAYVVPHGAGEATPKVPICQLYLLIVSILFSLTSKVPLRQLHL
jgi:hypothetical protein